MQVKRIVILGPCGAGKSTLARRIGARLSLPVVHLDRLNWTPGWVESDRTTFREQVAEVVNGDAWVMDGNYTSPAPIAHRLSRADAVIWLDLPRCVYFPRALWRALKFYGRAREDIGPGCPERIDVPFLKDWVWTYPARRAEHAEIMATLPTGVRGIVLRSRTEVATFTGGLPGSLNQCTAGKSSPAAASCGHSAQLAGRSGQPR
jgi:adenylate kinase family enzyme